MTNAPTASLTTATGVAGVANTTDATVAETNANTDYAIFLDTSKCTGCKGCQVACKCWNFLPSPLGLNANEPTGSYQAPADLNGDTRMIVTFNELDNSKKWGVNWSIGRRSCMHCINPACVAVCSSGALSVDAGTGFVVVDEKRCIGCQYCSTACPFDVPRYRSTPRTKINKCNACLGRTSSIRARGTAGSAAANGKLGGAGGATAAGAAAAGAKNGQLTISQLANITNFMSQSDTQVNTPACVNTCQTGALQFGKRNEMLYEAHSRLAYLQSSKRMEPALDASIYGETQMNGTHVIMLLKFSPASYGLPDSPSVNPITSIVKYAKPATGLATAATVLDMSISYFHSLGQKRNAQQQTIEKA